jgi:hypothetical protein
MVKTVLFAIIAVVLLGGAGYCWLGWDSVQKELAAAQGEVSGLQTTVENQASELAAAQDDLQTITAELQSTEDCLSTVEGELEASALKLSAMQSDVFNLHNPTFQEVLDFLSEDRTDKNEYREPNYVCSHFARDVNNNAESQGIRCAYVDIRYPQQAHAIVAFDTIDEGLVYFEPTSDERVRPVVGEAYWQCIEPAPGYFYEKPAFDDTIMDIVLSW